MSDRALESYRYAFPHNDSDDRERKSQQSNYDSAIRKSDGDGALNAFRYAFPHRD